MVYKTPDRLTSKNCTACNGGGIHLSRTCVRCGGKGRTTKRGHMIKRSTVLPGNGPYY